MIRLQQYEEPSWSPDGPCTTAVRSSQLGMAGDTFSQRGLSGQMWRSCIKIRESVLISNGGKGAESPDLGTSCRSSHLSSTPY